jgi:hypothetical protein
MTGDGDGGSMRAGHFKSGGANRRHCPRIAEDKPVEDGGTFVGSGEGALSWEAATADLGVDRRGSDFWAWGRLARQVGLAAAGHAGTIEGDPRTT